MYKVQCKDWDPIISWFNEKYDADVSKARDIMAPTISSRTKMAVVKHLMSYDEVAMHGFVFAVDVLKSLILTMACVDKHITVEEAVKLARLEEEFQIRYWGRVEWAHDVNQLDSQARLAASLLFIHFNSTHYLVKEKLAV